MSTADVERLRVLVVDDHDVVHWGFRLMLSELDWVERCLSARRRSSSAASVVSVGADERPSGRWSAERSSLSAAPTSCAQRARASCVRGCSEDSASETPKRRCTTPSWMVRAKSMRSSNSRARSPCDVAIRDVDASPSVLPSIHSRSRRRSSIGAAPCSGSARITPIQRPAATIGT